MSYQNDAWLYKGEKRDIFHVSLPVHSPAISLTISMKTG